MARASNTGNFVERFTSRKFLAAASAFAVAALIASGAIDASQEQAVIAQATPVLYIVVQGVIDFFKTR